VHRLHQLGSAAIEPPATGQAACQRSCRLPSLYRTHPIHLQVRQRGVGAAAVGAGAAGGGGPAAAGSRAGRQGGRRSRHRARVRGVRAAGAGAGGARPQHASGASLLPGRGTRRSGRAAATAPMSRTAVGTGASGRAVGVCAVRDRDDSRWLWPASEQVDGLHLRVDMATGAAGTAGAKSYSRGRSIFVGNLPFTAQVAPSRQMPLICRPLPSFCRVTSDARLGHC
jgi:hypothetical protein